MGQFFIGILRSFRLRGIKTCYNYTAVLAATKKEELEIKKLLSLLLVVMLVPVYALAATVDLKALSDEELVQLAQEIAAEQLSRVTYLAEGKLGVHFIGIKSVSIVKDYDGNDAISLAADYYHEDPDNGYVPNLNISLDARQEGNYLTHASVPNQGDSFLSFNEVKKGEVREMYWNFGITDLTKPVDFEFREGLGISFNQDYPKITYTWQP